MKNFDEAIGSVIVCALVCAFECVFVCARLCVYMCTCVGGVLVFMHAQVYKNIPLRTEQSQQK